MPTSQDAVEEDVNTSLINRKDVLCCPCLNVQLLPSVDIKLESLNDVNNHIIEDIEGYKLTSTESSELISLLSIPSSLKQLQITYPPTPTSYIPILCKSLTSKVVEQQALVSCTETVIAPPPSTSTSTATSTTSTSNVTNPEEQPHRWFIVRCNNCNTNCYGIQAHSERILLNPYLLTSDVINKHALQSRLSSIYHLIICDDETNTTKDAPYLESDPELEAQAATAIDRRRITVESEIQNYVRDKLQSFESYRNEVLNELTMLSSNSINMREQNLMPLSSLTAQRSSFGYVDNSKYNVSLTNVSLYPQRRRGSGCVGGSGGMSSHDLISLATSNNNNNNSILHHNNKHNTINTTNTPIPTSSENDSKDKTRAKSFEADFSNSSRFSPASPTPSLTVASSLSVIQLMLGVKTHSPVGTVSLAQLQPPLSSPHSFLQLSLGYNNNNNNNNDGNGSDSGSSITIQNNGGYTSSNNSSRRPSNSSVSSSLSFIKGISQQSNSISIHTTRPSALNTVISPRKKSNAIVSPGQLETHYEAHEDVGQVVANNVNNEGDDEEDDGIIVAPLFKHNSRTSYTFGVIPNTSSNSSSIGDSNHNALDDEGDDLLSRMVLTEDDDDDDDVDDDDDDDDGACVFDFEDAPSKRKARRSLLDNGKSPSLLRTAERQLSLSHLSSEDEDDEDDFYEEHTIGLNTSFGGSGVGVGVALGVSDAIAEEEDYDLASRGSSASNSNIHSMSPSFNNTSVGSRSRGRHVNDVDRLLTVPSSMPMDIPAGLMTQGSKANANSSSSIKRPSASTNNGNANNLGLGLGNNNNNNTTNNTSNIGLSLAAILPRRRLSIVGTLPGSVKSVEAVTAVDTLYHLGVDVRHEDDHEHDDSYAVEDDEAEFSFEDEDENEPVGELLSSFTGNTAQHSVKSRGNGLKMSVIGSYHDYNSTITRQRTDAIMNTASQQQPPSMYSNSNNNNNNSIDFARNISVELNLNALDDEELKMSSMPVVGSLAMQLSLAGRVHKK